MRIPSRVKRTLGTVRRRVRPALVTLRSRAMVAAPGSIGWLYETRRVHLGCGPKNIFPGWINVDIRPFPGVDLLLDVTREWPFQRLEYVYGEHFLEHIDIDDALPLLARIGESLAPGGKLRLSTPNLDYVAHTHTRSFGAPPEEQIDRALRTNRAFYGWGHQFLYTRELLEWILVALGFEGVTFYAYGESDDPALRGLEHHGGWEVVDGHPSVVNVEARRGARPIAADPEVWERIRWDFVRHVRAGH